MIGELSKKLHAGHITAAELTDSYIKRIEEKNPSLNAYVTLLFDKARADAARADKMLKAGLGGELCGIPYALKDNFCVKGYETGCCSRMLEGYKPIYSSTVVEKLESEGAVLLGQTNMDEFAMGSTSAGSIYGATKNPVNPAYAAGGSSGGSAAAVAADLAVFAIGSDTGGSVRQPAAFCGTTGFKPGYGAISRYGLIAYASSFDTVGILAGSADDAGKVFNVLAGRDDRDLTSTERIENIQPGKADGAVKIAVLSEILEKTEEDVRQAFGKMAEILKNSGAETGEVSMPCLKYALASYYIIACAEASSNLGRYDGVRYGHRAKEFTDADDMMAKSRTEGFGREVKKRIMLGTYVLQTGYYDDYYKKACSLREKISDGFSGIFEKYDFIALPTAPKGQIRLDEKLAPTDMYLGDLATVPANLAGIPAISINIGRDRNQMPVGMQLMAPKGRERELLLFAAEAEKRLKDGI